MFIELFSKFPFLAGKMSELLDWRIINLKLGNRDVGIALQLCLVSGQGKKVFIVLNEGLLGSQILVEFLLRLWALAAPGKHCYNPNSPRQISFYLN